MPPPKKRGQGLPPHLYRETRTKGTYYRYRNPHTGKWFGLGYERNRAVRIAKNVNRQMSSTLAGDERQVNRIIGDEGMQVDQCVERFMVKYRTSTNARGQSRAKATLSEAERYASGIARHWGGKDITSVTTLQISKFLDQWDVQPTTANQYRSMLQKVFRFAIQKGYRKDNPADAAERRTSVVGRQRLSKDEFDAIRVKAPAWLQNAMDLSLVTLQARTEIVGMKFSDERETGFMFIDREKVKNHNHGHIRIEIGPAVREILQRCRDDIASPFVIHRRPRRQTVAQRYALEHWSQVTGDFLLGEFKKARDKAGVGASEGQTPPTFHEIRSLGGRALEDQGYPKEYVRLLMGHSSMKMTDVYLDSRGGQVKYVDAKAP